MFKFVSLMRKKIDDKDDAFNADLMIETMFVFTIPWKNSSWLY